MKPKDRIVTFPRMGKNQTKVIKGFLESLDLNVMEPPKTTDKTVRIGAENCANMACYPLKQTLGNYIEAIENGANTLLAYDTQGVCRFRQYNKLHEFTLTGLGYDFDMRVINPKNILRELSDVSGKSKLKVMKEIWNNYKKLEDFDNENSSWSDDKPNIGIIGEIFCCVDETANQGLESKIRKFGGNPYNTSTTTDFMMNKIPFFSLYGLKNMFKEDKLKPYKEEAKKYMDDWRSGHAFENIYNLLDMADRNVDGVVHVAPLSCMPETTIEPYVDEICSKEKIPLLRIAIDENSAEANLETRLETFVELIKIRGKNGKR